MHRHRHRHRRRTKVGSLHGANARRWNYCIFRVTAVAGRVGADRPRGRHVSNERHKNRRDSNEIRATYRSTEDRSVALICKHAVQETMTHEKGTSSSHTNTYVQLAYKVYLRDSCAYRRSYSNPIKRIQQHYDCSIAHAHASADSTSQQFSPSLARKLIAVEERRVDVTCEGLVTTNAFAIDVDAPAKSSTKHCLAEDTIVPCLSHYCGYKRGVRCVTRGAQQHDKTAYLPFFLAPLTPPPQAFGGGSGGSERAQVRAKGEAGE